MGKIKFKKLNNQGSTFVLSLLVITLLTTLALALANASLGNMMMKSVDRNSKDAFYTSETLLDEIRAGIGHESVRNLGEAYEYVLTNIVDSSSGFPKVLSNSDANLNLKSKYIEYVLSDITGGLLAFANADVKEVSSLTDAINPSDIHNRVIDYINSEYIQGYVDGMAEVTSIGHVEAYKDSARAYQWIVIVKDVAVSYKERKSGEVYFSNITVDLEIEYPNMVVDFTNTNRITDFTNFSLIADNSINMVGQNINVHASVYAGNLLDVASSNSTPTQVLFQPSSSSYINIDVICGGDTIDGSGTIRVGGNTSVQSTAHFKSTNIWCTNIATRKMFDGAAGPQDATAGAVITIDENSNSYVRDDLAIDAQNSNVTVLGEYYGYKHDGVDTPVGHLASSAIIVNGKHSNVHIGASKLFLGGRAYIDIASGQYVTGEALSLRASQEAYLVPPEYLGVNYGVPLTNPVSKTEWESIKEMRRNGEVNEDTGLPIKEFELPADYFANAYLHTGIPYTERAVGSDLVYIYFNFKNNTEAANYIKAVASGADEEMKKVLDRYTGNLFGNGNSVTVTTPESSIDSTGVFMEVDNRVTGHAVGTANMSPNTSTDLDNRYQILTHLLAGIPWDEATGRHYVLDKRVSLKELRGYEISDEELIDIMGQTAIMNNLVDTTLLSTNLYNPSGKKIAYGDPHETYVKIATNADVRIDESNPIDGGIIITTGSVEVCRNFKGLIIAGGNIDVKGNVRLTTDANMVEEFIVGKEEFEDPDYEEDIPFKEYFIAYKSSATDEDSREEVKIENVDYKDLVNFNNWRKYEDR